MMSMNDKGRILVVDDDADILDTLKDVLELEGYETETASDGFKALDAVRNSSFDVVLMDIKMPVMNGVETFKKLRAISADTPVIMISAYAVEDLVREALREGAFAALKKPVDFDQLFHTIESARGDGALVLVVDDEDQVRTVLSNVLDDKGFRTKTAKDGEHAIAMARANNFDVIVLDMKLPVLNGLETYLAIRSIRPDAVVIVMTGYPMEMMSLAKQAVEKSAYVCLQKPIDVDDLLTLINKIMAEKSRGELNKPDA